MKDSKFQDHAYQAGVALCHHINYKRIAEQSPHGVPPQGQLPRRIGTIATGYYRKLKVKRNKIVAKVKKFKKGVKQFTLIRDRHVHLPFLLAGFALFNEYSIPFQWIEEAFDSKEVKTVHMKLKNCKVSQSRVGTRAAIRQNGTGVTPKGSRENHVETSDIKNNCIYSNARFRNEDPTHPETVAFQLFPNYVHKDFENTLIMYINLHHHPEVTREQAIAEARAHVKTPAFRKRFPTKCCSGSAAKVTQHEQGRAYAWSYFQEKYQGAFLHTADRDAASVIGYEDTECSLPALAHDLQLLDDRSCWSIHEATREEETSTQLELSLEPPPEVGAPDNDLPMSTLDLPMSSHDTRPAGLDAPELQTDEVDSMIDGFWK